jgi:cell pole-organizing protein PopZ
MTQPAKSQEPSMEEILASIRRIIADDDANKPRPAEAPKAAAPAAPPPRAPAPPPPPRQAAPAPRPAEPPAPVADYQSSDILDLTESMASPQPAASPAPALPPQFRTIEGASDVGFDEVAAEKPSLQRNIEEARRHFSVDERNLLSRETSVAVDSAFNTLAQSVLVQNARTLEDLVREMLRPMLKAWLDDNLPPMVERLVRDEIDRVARGRTG